MKSKYLALLTLVFFVVFTTLVWAQNSSPDTNTSATPASNTAGQSSTDQTSSSSSTNTDRSSAQSSSTSDQDTAKFSKPGASGQETDIAKRLDAAADVLDAIMKVPEKGIPEDALTHAKCVVVIPSTVKIAFMFGGEHGKGVATCRTNNGWSAPAPVGIAGGSWGLQAGGEAVDLVMLVMSQKGLDSLLTDKFKIGASASGAAGPVGRQAEGSTDVKFKSDILTYSRARGLFGGINLNGAVVKQDKDETAVLYGKIIPFQTILSGSVHPPADSKAFLSAIRKYASQARENKQSGS
jgi:lipid-binding SYLF domain-containing protein